MRIFFLSNRVPSKNSYSLNAAKLAAPKVAQELARHSIINLTMKRYTHLNLLDVGGAVDQLSLPKPKQREQNQVTGTDDRSIVLPSRCPTPVNSGPKLSSNGKTGKNHRGGLRMTKTPAVAGVRKAEGKGLEPSTPCGAPDFESGC